MTSSAATTSERPGAWTIEAVLRWTQDYFAGKGIDTARLDAEILLAHALGVGRVHLYTHYDQPLRVEERDAYRALVRRRGAREPVAYIVGKREFFGRDFGVGPEVLIPRPETEHVIEGALEWLRDRGCTAPRILDIGTGSGALALTLAAEFPEAQVVATDISPAALRRARDNAVALQVDGRVTFVECDLDSGVEGAFDLVVSNPPYVAPDDALPADVRDFEPSLALFAEEQGLATIRRLAARVPERLLRPGLFLCEMGAEQWPAVRELLQGSASWDELRVLSDLQGHGRVALARFAGDSGAP